MIRLLRPKRIVETGVFDGESPAVEFLAIEGNGEGQLISIDLPAVGNSIRAFTDQMQEGAFPPGCNPGWLVPDELKGPWQLLLASKEV